MNPLLPPAASRQLAVNELEAEVRQATFSSTEVRGGLENGDQPRLGIDDAHVVGGQPAATRNFVSAA